MFTSLFALGQPQTFTLILLRYILTTSRFIVYTNLDVSQRTTINQLRCLSWRWMMILLFRGTMKQSLSMNLALLFNWDSSTCSVVFYTCKKISVYNFLDKSCKLLVDLAGQPFNMNFINKRPWFKMYEFIECLAVVWLMQLRLWWYYYVD